MLGRYKPIRLGSRWGSARAGYARGSCAAARTPDGEHGAGRAGPTMLRLAGPCLAPLAGFRARVEALAGSNAWVSGLNTASSAQFGQDLIQAPRANRMINTLERFQRALRIVKVCSAQIRYDVADLIVRLQVLACYVDVQLVQPVVDF